LSKQVLQRGVGFARGLFYLAVGGRQFVGRDAVKLCEPEDGFWTDVGKEGGDVHRPLAALAGRQGVHGLLMAANFKGLHPE
jgi:hypothetical protein